MNYDANDGCRDEKLEQAVGLLVLTGRASTSFLQRKLGLGYNDAARLMEIAQAEGIVAPPNHVGKREVLLVARSCLEKAAPYAPVGGVSQ